jgi:3-hydroxyisobutyrate dehydrogenase
LLPAKVERPPAFISQEEAMKIAVIGCGEVGLLYAGALHGAAEKLYLCDPNPSSKLLLFSQQTGVVPSPYLGEWLRQADLVLSCVVGTMSLRVASAAFPYMQKGAMFADLTTCDPGLIRKAALLAAEVGIEYVDVSIMGVVALGGVNTALLCSGPSAAKLVRLFETIGAPARVVTDGAAGDAAALKMLRSVFAKGLEALAIETFMAAEKQGLTEQLYEVLADIDKNPLRSTLESLIRTHLIHAPRRLHEIQEAERLLEESGLSVAVLPGVRALFERTCHQLERQPIEELPATAQEAFDWLLANASASSTPKERGRSIR